MGEIPGPKSSVSRDEFVRFMRGFDPIDYAKVRASGRGRASSEAVEFEIHYVWRLRRGLFARMDAYLDEDEPLEAAGLISDT